MTEVHQPRYVLGVGLSHNGSAVLLQDGVVAVAIEKERLSRIKHDGGNDNLAVEYCLNAAGISLSEVELVVQTANFEIPDRYNFHGPRLIGAYQEVPLFSISHHVAHAYSAVGTCPFSQFNVLIVDGCGSPFKQCMDIDADTKLLEKKDWSERMACEKDSLYFYDGKKLHTVVKDFSEMAPLSSDGIQLPTTQHSIGGFYSALSHYCFGNMNDAGKLMGLAAFGQEPAISTDAFYFVNDQLLVRDDWQMLLNHPARSPTQFQTHFQYYANVAKWAQMQVERALKSLLDSRQKWQSSDYWAYSGGVALNAVANSKLLQQQLMPHLYIEPAAGDNGLALGCAYYGWLEVLKQPRQVHNGSTCFGKCYSDTDFKKALAGLPNAHFFSNTGKMVDKVAQSLQEGQVVGWFQDGSEFGPRALGHRSILAGPSNLMMQEHINRNIKFREDFRPFAPAVCAEKVAHYFQYGLESPYMILVDEVRPEWQEKLVAVCHRDGSARVQTVTADWNPVFYALLQATEQISGLGVLLNTSFNRKGEPIVETPEQALEVFKGTAMDVLVLGNWVVEKIHAYRSSKSA